MMSHLPYYPPHWNKQTPTSAFSNTYLSIQIIYIVWTLHPSYFVHCDTEAPHVSFCRHFRQLFIRLVKETPKSIKGRHVLSVHRVRSRSPPFILQKILKQVAKRAKRYRKTTKNTCEIQKYPARLSQSNSKPWISGLWKNVLYLGCPIPGVWLPLHHSHQLCHTKGTPLTSSLSLLFAISSPMQYCTAVFIISILFTL